MKVAVIGAGAVGLGLGSCLIEADTAVHFLVRNAEAADALRRGGISRTGIFGTVEAPAERFTASTSWSDLPKQAPDHVLVCTKTPAAASVARDLAGVWPSFREEPAIVLCQNGWGTAESFAELLPRERIFNARVITGFRRLDWRSLEVTVHAQPIRMGSLYGRDPQTLAPLCRAITAGGIPCEPSEAIEKDLLAKLLYNCALNPLAALRGVSYGELAADPRSRRVLEVIVEEIFAVLDRARLETYWSSAAEYLAFFDSSLLPPTREHHPSMLQDLRAGQRTEIRALCGAVADLGRSVGVPTPVNEALLALVGAIEPPAS